jgi:hypothetical protein
MPSKKRRREFLWRLEKGLAMEIVPRIDKDREKVLTYFLQQKQARPITVHFILH